MSITGVVDICFHICSFRNIDLVAAGLYVVQLTPPANAKPVPHTLERCSAVSDARCSVAPAFFDDQSFYSSAVLIRYAEEDVPVNDLVIFRMELDMDPPVTSLPIRMQLLYADWENCMTARLSDFAPVFTQDLVLKYPLTSSCQFIPATFGASFCQVSLCVYTFLLDFLYASKELVQLKLEEIVSKAALEAARKLMLTKLAEGYQNMRETLRDYAKFAAREDWPGIDEVERPTAQAVQTDMPGVFCNIAREVHGFTSKMFLVQFYVVQLSKEEPLGLASFLQSHYIQAVASHLKKLTMTEQYPLLSLLDTVSTVTDQRQIAERLRTATHTWLADKYEVHRPSTFKAADPILFHHMYYNDSNVSAATPVTFSYLPKRMRQIHLVVLVHGYLGSSRDLRLLKNVIGTLRPDCYLHVSLANENCTDDSLDTMGKRLADELRTQISAWDSTGLLKRVSFIGYSLGGLICRASLPYLQQYTHLFHFYISLSTPHLGHLHLNHTTVATGLWIMRKLKRSECLNQITLNDSNDLTQGFLYKLNRTAGFQGFKHVALVTSLQDQYVPYSSAFAEVDESLKPSIKQVHTDMVESLMATLQAGRLHRLNFDYLFHKQTLNRWLGRSAHTEILASEKALLLLYYSLASFFH